METQSHYQFCNLDFQCLDQVDVLKQVDECILDHNLTSLIIDYGPKHAWCGWNFGADDTPGLMKSWTQKAKDIHGFKTRWIALFHVHKQHDFVNQLLERYNFSSRLRASLLSAPAEGNLEIAERIWHWSSVEHGDKYRAIGYNTLFSFDRLKIPERPDDNNNIEDSNGSEFSRRNTGETNQNWWTTIKREHRTQKKENVNGSDLESSRQRTQATSRTHPSTFNISNFKRVSPQTSCVNEVTNFSDIHYHPRMLRLWMWIILTDDGTVISIHEPFPVHDGDADELNKSNAKHIRRNLRVVLRCLSEARLPQQANASSRDTGLAIDDGALLLRKTNCPTGDLLLYYLFDDWYTTWDIVVKRCHPYSEDLNHIKDEDPRLTHINKLHDIIRRLASLKRIYQSYELVIERLLDEGKNFFDEKSPLAFRPAALSRIARLKYRVQYLAVTEIEDCELETQGLISLTYSRLNFRETQAVEKLTLLSVGLAKVTIVFLPLSLIMAYYSMNVDGITGLSTKRDFWVSVGVALFLTLCFLLLINRLSKAMQSGKRKNA